MQDKLAVSVVVPVYNAEKYLQQCLNSILRQSLKEIEVIAVDDGSTDGSGKILSEYQKKDKRLTVISKQNEGVSIARNLAVAKARGKYISFVDSDDYLEPSALEKLYNRAAADNLDMLMFAATTLDMNTGRYNKERLYNFRYLDDDFDPPFFNEQTDAGLWRKFAPSACLTFYRRKFLVENSLEFIRGMRFEDCLFFKQAFFLAQRAGIMREPLYIRRRHRESAVASGGRHLMDYMRINGIICELAQKRALSVSEINAFIASTVSYTIVLFKQIDVRYRKEYFELMKNYFGKYCGKEVLSLPAARKHRKEVKDVLRSCCLTGYHLHRGWRVLKQNMFSHTRKNNKVKICVCGLKFSFKLKGAQAMKYIRLNNGNLMPALGFGTFPMKGKELRQAVRAGVRTGFRLFDTATAYRNEQDLGRALWGKHDWFGRWRRPHYFITTKLFLDDCRRHTERKALLASMKKLGVSYVDLYLMHWADPDCFVDNWKAMERLYKEGLAKNIGVCNFEIHHLQKLLDECEIVPAVNQVECHPLLTQKPLLDFCRKHGIIVQSYSPFARMDKKLIENPLLLELAGKYRKKTTQIILKWNIQQGRGAVPKSSNPERLRDNFNIFDFSLSRSELGAIDTLNEDYRIRFHPDVYPVVNYPNKNKGAENENCAENAK